MSRNFFRRLTVLLLCLVPLTTLVHRNDVGRWDFNRCAMAAPDELSYLLMAKSIARDHTISTTALAGRDTFYPPGYPLILAAWGKIFGFSIESMHTCTALLLCAAAGAAYLLMVKLLSSDEKTLNAKRETLKEESPTQDSSSPNLSSFSVQRSAFLPLLLLALFVFNWHVLEGALFIFSEPAFMLITFSWLLLALKWPAWYLSWKQTLCLALLAAAAISVRGAGIVCFAAMILYPLVGVLLQLKPQPKPHPAARQLRNRLLCLALVLAVLFAYQFLIAQLSPEKSLAAGNDSSNSYTKQLLHGLTDGHRLSLARPQDWRPFLANASNLLASHVDDFSESFVPWLREVPRAGLLNLIGKFALLFALAGWLWKCIAPAPSTNTDEQNSPHTRFVEWYIGLYIALYLIWPFNMARFWAPILPVMLAYIVIALRDFGTRPTASLPKPPTKPFCPCGKISCATILTFAFLSLLLTLHVEEYAIQLPHYQRRLNYVSDALAQASQRIVKLSPDPAHTSVCVLGSDEHFVFAWYLPAAGGGLPISARPNAVPHERFEDVALHKLADVLEDPRQRVFVVSYFTHQDVEGAFGNMGKQDPELFSKFVPKKVFQKGIEVAVWEFVPLFTPSKNP